MFELLKAGGILMVPILFCSVLALAIILERFWSLRDSRIAPPEVLNELWRWIKKKELNGKRLKTLQASSPMGRVLASGLLNAKHGREVMKESIEHEASQVVHQLERFLNPLGTVATITPLLGLLGTVIGMIKVFAEIQLAGVGNAGNLAGGISEALITTASGLSVAIPALIAHRYFIRRVDALVVNMEQEAIKLVEVVHGDREIDVKGA
ncbi:MotA/TolQ/ExbB proton channel family protein [Marinobacter sp. M3C]|uniref:MotA/TolQ/ExbB proton channel family protein n=1 Tax=unclassified Marinobacter TaxID=83889 RepID=UPI00200C772C|nr:MULTISPECIES: MotA/TolQ/ExbB proton channel family protein [unclassified Marinobacter]MCL1477051.1 MotA/TolQ/ExbB proton channel family protein [Marinobacter sp.]MCL1482447.1 MotA/TolQ/ExbB proton channel family protein [Marinobacter sp.]MCL1486254.1 MotA/TolQ/ExbB proton channel family protein [Marinobacter sp.]MCL1488632.1 MotA/TolQ/ExbB proton channel family protein [Marinobacter sp.]UQG54283.1 MotA/TolQ/ExbB proton channel family protein [Marinobacter sp. M4C]